MSDKTFRPSPPPVGPGEKLETVQLDSHRLHAEVGKVLKALAGSDAMNGLNMLEMSVVLGFVLGVYLQGGRAKLKPDVPFQQMLPAVWLGYCEAERMGIADHIRKAKTQEPNA